MENPAARKIVRPQMPEQDVRTAVFKTQGKTPGKTRVQEVQTQDGSRRVRIRRQEKTKVQQERKNLPARQTGGRTMRLPAARRERRHRLLQTKRGSENSAKTLCARSNEGTRRICRRAQKKSSTTNMSRNSTNIRQRGIYEQFRRF